MGEGIQNPDESPKCKHIPSPPSSGLNRGDLGLRRCPRNAGERGGRGISAHSKH